MKPEWRGEGAKERMCRCREVGRDNNESGTGRKVGVGMGEHRRRRGRDRG